MPLPSQRMSAKRAARYAAKQAREAEEVRVRRAGFRNKTAEAQMRAEAAKNDAAEARPAPNTACPKCRHVFHVPDRSATVDCPACGAHFDEAEVECWAQTVWPTPEHVAAGHFGPAAGSQAA